MLSFTRASVACFCKGPMKASQQNIGARRRVTHEKHLVHRVWGNLFKRRHTLGSKGDSNGRHHCLQSHNRTRY